MKLNIFKQWAAFAVLLLFPNVLSAQNVSSVITERLKKETIENQLFNQVTGVNAAYLDKAPAILKSVKPDGSWPDVDYKDTDNDWSPVLHMERLLVLSYAYNKPGNPLYQSSAAQKAIQNALDYWFAVKPVCVNWFKNEITRPIHFSTIGLLMQGKIKATTLNNIINVLPLTPIRSTTDRVRSAYCVLHRGVIQNNPELIRVAINGIAATYVQTTDDGIQSDWSYHYHGPLLYTAGYGLDLLNFTLTLLPIVKDTELDFTQAQKVLLDNFITYGLCTVMYGNQLDYSTMGRQVASTSRYVDSFVKHLEFMKTVFPDKTSFYQNIIDGIVNKSPQNIIGNTHFWNSDFQVQRSTHYYTSVHLCSTRTIGMESLNHENLKGMWSPFGVNYILRKGNEYDGIFNVWNWKRLPGTTTPDTLVTGISGITQKTDFVGGVSDGKAGVAVMDFDYFNTKAKKAWFFFDNEWVALGCNISSTDSHEVATTINQCLWKSDVVTDAGKVNRGTLELSNPKWVLQDGIGYVFPQNEKVMLKADQQSGSHSAIYSFGSKELEHKEVFSLYIPHGIRPANETYSYIVVPSVTETELKAYSEQPPVQILSNTSAVQAVRNSRQNVTEIVFHQAGSFKVGDITLTVDRPCLMLCNKSEIWVSDPTTKLTDVKVSILRNGNIAIQQVTFPSGSEAGKSIRTSLLLTNEISSTQAFLLEKDLPWENLGGGVKRQILGYDNRLMIVKVAFEKGAIGAPHTHPHSQSTFVAAGKFEVEVAGKKQILSAGDGFFVASGLLHGVKCLETGILVDSFSPVREDFLKNK